MNCKIQFAAVAIITALISSFALAAEKSVIKKSRSGICHCPGGTYYEKTKNFTPFRTIKECLDSGGRHPKSGQGNCDKASSSSFGSPITDIGHRVIDGDTIDVDGERFRLRGIDAPETDQVCKDKDGREYLCGETATSALVKFTSNGVRCGEDLGKDRYGRSLSTCFTLDGVNVNAWMVANGHALAYRKYSDRYVKEEELARAKGLGMHAGEFEAPWDWRKR